jgi:DNA invertase Pin-like site-specific DNA recombinase
MLAPDLLFMLLGLIRDDENGEQRRRLAAVGCRVIEDSLPAAQNRLAPGDTLVVTSLDRLDLNSEETFSFLHTLLLNKRADLRALDNKLDTGGPCRDHLLAWLNGVYKTSVVVKKERRLRGAKAARRSSARKGRPAVLQKERFLRAYRLVEKGEVTERGAIMLLGVSKSTYYRHKKQYLNKM